MSIIINDDICIGCGECQKICPGNLIYTDQYNKAYMKYPKDCWGCAACVKECKTGAIRYYLGADIGGSGTYLYTLDNGETMDFIIIKGNEKKVITVNRKESNKY